jgi:hypothetical protein
MKLEKILDKLGSLEKLFCKIIDTITSKNRVLLKGKKPNSLNSWSSYFNKPKYRKNPS